MAERAEAAQCALRKAREPLPAPAVLFRARAEFQAAAEVQKQAAATVKQAETKIERLRENAPTSVMSWLTGARRRHAGRLHLIEQEWGRALQEQEVSQDRARELLKRVREQEAEYERAAAKNRQERRREIEWAEAELAWVHDARLALGRDAFWATDPDGLEQAVAVPNDEVEDLDDQPTSGLSFC